jgi:hypothetical protein
MKRYEITVQGHWHKWGLEIDADDQTVYDLRRDGFQMDELVNTIPEQSPIPVWLWCWLQDMKLVRK